jgi:tRNA pseudouridine13 synthase
MRFKKFVFKPLEFVVEEITRDGAVLEVNTPADFGKPEDQALERDYFTHFILQKSGWNTMQALAAIARHLHARANRFDFAGTKDRASLSTQLCSAFALPPQRLLAVRLKDLRVLGAWKARERVRLGDLAGNRFTITLTKQNCGVTPDAKKIAARAKKLGYRFPNYFGAQRFGSLRANAAAVGFALLRKDFEGAVREYLCATQGEKLADAVRARRRLARENDFAAALKYFPRYLKFERLLLEHLAAAPRDFAGALSRLPRHLQLLFVHAVQSRLFNDELEARVRAGTLFSPEPGDWWCEANELGFPNVGAARPVEDAGEVKKLVAEHKAFLVSELLGADSKPSPSQKKLLEENRLSLEDFRFKTLSWLTTRGGKRVLFAPLEGFKVLSEEPVRLRFSLPSGSYATIALQELLKAR